MLFPIILIYVLSTHILLFILLTSPSVYFFSSQEDQALWGQVYVSYLLLFATTIKALCVMEFSVVGLNFKLNVLPLNQNISLLPFTQEQNSCPEIPNNQWEMPQLGGADAVWVEVEWNMVML